MLTALRSGPAGAHVRAGATANATPRSEPQPSPSHPRRKGAPRPSSPNRRGQQPTARDDAALPGPPPPLRPKRTSAPSQAPAGPASSVSRRRSTSRRNGIEPGADGSKLATLIQSNDNDHDELEHGVFDDIYEQEGDEVILDQDEVERLVFGDKDFTEERGGPNPAQTANGAGVSGAIQYQGISGQAQSEEVHSVRVALRGSGLATPDALVDLVVEAVAEQLAPRQADVLVASLARVLDVVSELPPQAIATPTAPLPAGPGAENVPPAAVRALTALHDALGHPGAGLLQVVAAALRVPQVLRLTHHDVRQRIKMLGPLLGLPPERVALACSTHPELLVADLEAVRRKLQQLKNTTGLTGEGAVAIMTPHMFPGL